VTIGVDDADYTQGGLTVVRLCTEPEDPSARPQSALEFDTGDRSAAALALACFAAVRRITADVDHEPLAGAQASRPAGERRRRHCESRRAREHMATARR